MNAAHPSGWIEVPGGALIHEHAHDVRLVRDGDGWCVEILDRHHRSPATSCRTLEGELLDLPAVVSPRWLAIGRVATPAEGYSRAVGALLAGDMHEDVRIEIEHRERDQRRGFSRDRAADHDQVRELRMRLDDPHRVVAALGIGKGARRQNGGGVLICCPSHLEATPSCSVTLGRDRTIRVRCFGCQWSADVLGLVAVVNRLDVHRQFREVLDRAREIAGYSNQGDS